MQEVEDQDILFAKLKTRFKTLFKNSENKCDVNSKSKVDVYVFQQCYRDFKKKVYICVRYLVQKKRKILFDSSHKQIV